MTTSTIVNTKLKTYCFPNYREANIGFYDILEDYAEGSTWKVKKEWVNIFQGNYFNISNIESIILDYKRGEILISFIHGDTHNIKYISIKENNYGISITLFNEEGGARDRYVGKYGFYNLTCIFKSLCSFDTIYEEGIVIDITGQAYQTSYLQNHYNEKEIHALDGVDIDQ